MDMTTDWVKSQHDSLSTNLVWIWQILGKSLLIVTTNLALSVDTDIHKSRSLTLMLQKQACFSYKRLLMLCTRIKSVPMKCVYYSTSLRETRTADWHAWQITKPTPLPIILYLMAEIVLHHNEYFIAMSILRINWGANSYPLLQHDKPVEIQVCVRLSIMELHY